MLTVQVMLMLPFLRTTVCGIARTFVSMQPVPCCLNTTRGWLEVSSGYKVEVSEWNSKSSGEMFPCQSGERGSFRMEGVHSIARRLGLENSRNQDLFQRNPWLAGADS